MGVFGLLALQLGGVSNDLNEGDLALSVRHSTDSLGNANHSRRRDGGDACCYPSGTTQR